jgi:ABC-type transporter Mla maintaining outer membrane lipid asymmetry ATPase subunit MlaF
MTLPLLQAQGLTLSSFANDAGFDITMESGQRWLLTGASGAGKSTLMRTLLGLISPRSGSVLVDGVNLQDVSPKQLLRLRHSMGVVFSGGGLLPAWSGLQNLMLPLRAGKGLDEAQAEAAVLAFASQCHIPTAWLERAAAQLSAEQGTLLSLARALIITPKLLWLDSELVWGVLSHASTRLGAQLAEQVAQGCTLVVCAGAGGLAREHVPPCPGPTHWARLQDGWLECAQAPTYWTLETADDQTPLA